MPKRLAINAQGGPLREAAIYAWGERLFTPLLHAALAAYQSEWDADFLADRKRVFPNVDFDTLDVSDPDRRSQVRAYLGTVEAQLNWEGFSGRYAGGWLGCSCLGHGVDDPQRAASADANCGVPSRDSLTGMSACRQIGTGHREDAEIEVAWRALKSSEKRVLPPSDRDEPLAPWVGGPVGISCPVPLIAEAPKAAWRLSITSRRCWSWSLCPVSRLRCGFRGLATTFARV